MGALNEKNVRGARAYSRREMLGLLGTAAGAMAGWGLIPGGAEFFHPMAFAATAPSCIVRPEQTEGPYFVDAKLNRSDIRSDPADKSARPGVPLRLRFQVSRITGGVCNALDGAIVDIWQCDALGIYSGVRDINGGFDTTGKSFLRGYQVTNSIGIAEFVTIYPGWYRGRAVHIHFKIHGNVSSARAHEFTSQLYFDDSVSDQVYKQAPYNTKGLTRTTNREDFGFRRNGKQLMPALMKAGEGYRATFDIGLQFA